jgi:predicted nucleotidyltransferase
MRHVDVVPARHNGNFRRLPPTGVGVAAAPPRRVVPFARAGANRPDSNVDLLVEFRRNKSPNLFKIVDLRDELSKLFKGRKVDVVTLAALQNPYRCRATEPDLEPIYASG